MVALLSLAGLYVATGPSWAQSDADAGVRAWVLIDVNPLLSGYGIGVVASDRGLRLAGTVTDAPTGNSRAPWRLSWPTAPKSTMR